MIDIHFSITEEEYLEAQKLYMSTNKKLKRMRRGALIVFSITIIAVAVAALKTPPRTGEVFQQFFPLSVLMLLFLACLSPTVQKRNFKKRFLKERRNLANSHLVLDDTGYHMEVPGIGGGTAEWGGMDGWLEGTQVIILPAGLLMRIFPKAPLTEIQIEEARALLTDKLGPVGVMRKR
jgi:hypothetical protein